MTSNYTSLLQDKHIKNKDLVFKAINWNRQVDDYSLLYWAQNVQQMWIDTEFVPSKDKLPWSTLTPEFRELYKKVLGGLTLLDTIQSNIGMNVIAEYQKHQIQKTVLSFMGMMEGIHAKSYSTIFTTLIDSDIEIQNVFTWVEEHENLQFKARFISTYYENAKEDTNISQYLALVASVFLESFLFYSGFFFPLYLSGQGTMIASGEIIKKILQDEAIHGLYVGRLAQDIYAEMTERERELVDKETIYMLETLMKNEVRYTEDVYSESGLAGEVKNFIIYNANKAMMNLGKEPHYEDKEINPIVLVGLNTESDTHDFFSTKGSGYVKAIHEPLTDDSFIFDLTEDI